MPGSCGHTNSDRFSLSQLTVLQTCRAKFRPGLGTPCMSIWKLDSGTQWGLRLGSAITQTIPRFSVPGVESRLNLKPEQSTSTTNTLLTDYKLSTACRHVCVLAMIPGASHLLGKCSDTEPHAWPLAGGGGVTLTLGPETQLSQKTSCLTYSSRWVQARGNCHKVSVDYLSSTPVYSGVKRQVTGHCAPPSHSLCALP